MLAKLGEKLTHLLGEQDFGFQKPSELEDFYQRLLNFSKIADLLPYERFDESTRLFYHQNTVGFVLEVPPLVGSSQEMQKEVSGIFQNLLFEESSLQVMLYADPHIGRDLERWQATRTSPSAQSLAHKRVEYLNSFAFDSPNFPYTLRQFRCLLSFSAKEPHKSTQVEKIKALQTQIKTALELLGLSVLIWSPKDLIDTLGSLLNMNGEDTTPFERRWNKFQPLNEQIAEIDTHLAVNSDSLSLNNRIQIRTYQAVQAPEAWSLHAMGQLIGDEERDLAQLGCPFILHYGVHVPKQSAPKTQVLSKATYVERQATSPIGKFLPSIQQEAEELTFVREQLGKGERIVQTSLNIVLFSKPEALASIEQTLINLYISKEWQLKPNTYFHLPVLLSVLPMVWNLELIQSMRHHKKLKTTLSTESANLLPLQGEWKGTPTQGLLLAGRRGQLLTWYPFDNETGNYNVSVVGRSGSGKSVFMQELIQTVLGLNGKVFVLDVGRSFEKICDASQGQFIEFRAKTPIGLNPFSSLPLDEEAAQDALAILKSVLILMAAPTQGVDDLEAALLEKAMLKAWKTHQRDCTITHIANALLAEENPKAQHLGLMLFPYTEHGNYGRFFNGPATVNLDNPFVVLELEELKERKDLQAVIVQMVIINITNKMFLGDRKTPFMIVFDEAWDLLRHAQSAVFIETLARRLRKYYGSLVVGTQSMNDLFASPAAQAAFDNSDWTCLLSQKPETIAQLKKLDRLALTEAAEQKLISVKAQHGLYAEVMIMGSHGFAVGRLLLDPYSLLLYSTKAQDYTAVKSLRDTGLSLEQALETILKQRSEQHENKTH